MTEQQQPGNNGQNQQVVDDDGIPQEVRDMEAMAVKIEKEAQRLRDTKRDMVAKCREDKLVLADVVSDLFDELVNLNAQVVAAMKASAKGVDASFQFTEALLPDEDDEDDDEDDDDLGAESFVAKSDANLFGAVLGRARFQLMMIESPDVTIEKLRESLKKENVLSEIDTAIHRLSQIEEGAPPPTTESN
jgi:hypothetical protein